VLRWLTLITNTTPNNKNLINQGLSAFLDVDLLDQEPQGPSNGVWGGAGPGFAFTKRPLPPGKTAQYSTYRTSTLLTLNQALNAGLGSITDNSCGALVYGRSIVCSSNQDHTKLTFGGSSCKQPGCPVCYTSWAFRGAHRITERIEGFRQFDHYSPKHIILGADPKKVDLTWIGLMVPKKGLDYLKSYFRSRAFEVGLIGGAMVVHLYRIKKEVKDLVPPGAKIWAWVRSQGADRFHSLVDFSPHAHIIGYGYTIKIQKGNDSFLYRSAGNLKTVDAVEAAAFYMLSHSPVIPGCTAVTYFGKLSYNKLKCKKVGTRYETIKCPDCGAAMVDEGSLFPVYRHVTILTWWMVTGPPPLPYLSQLQANRRDEPLGEPSGSPADANAMSDHRVQGVSH
jgi:hypothetical protein